jgi:hypothetical protein
MVLEIWVIFLFVHLVKVVLAFPVLEALFSVKIFFLIIVVLCLGLGLIKLIFFEEAFIAGVALSPATAMLHNQIRLGILFDDKMVFIGCSTVIILQNHFLNMPSQ